MLSSAFSGVDRFLAFSIHSTLRTNFWHLTGMASCLRCASVGLPKLSTCIHYVTPMQEWDCVCGVYNRGEAGESQRSVS